ncbi:MAG: cytochrome-c peroxidase, partial [Pseudomonadota bacterium]
MITLEISYLTNRLRIHPSAALRYPLSMAVLSMALAGCNGTSDTPDTTNDTPGEIVGVGAVRTIQIDNVVLSSLPDSVTTATSAQIALGRLLFWDPVLSGDQDVACATCHLPQHGYADGRRRSAGTGGVGAGPARVPGQIGQVSRNSQSVLNTAWNGINEFGVFNADTAPMFWDGRTRSLANQALEPILAREEMRGDNFSEAQIEAEVISRLNAVSEYQQLFATAYGNSTITMEAVTTALADFQTSLVANNSPFDRYLRGDTGAMNNAQIAGMREFVEHDCANCHSGPMFSDFDTHVLGVREAAGLAQPDDGNGNFAFRTPSLRQLAFTAPYFHGGQEADLTDAIDFYDGNNNSDNPNVSNNQLDADFRNLPNLNNGEINA